LNVHYFEISPVDFDRVGMIAIDLATITNTPLRFTTVKATMWICIANEYGLMIFVRSLRREATANAIVRA